MDIGPKLNTNNLIFCIDPLNPKSYSGTGTEIREISGVPEGQITSNTIGSGKVTRGGILFENSSDYLRFERDDINAGSFVYDYISFYVWIKTFTSDYNANNTNCNIITIENVFEISIGDNRNGFSSVRYASNPWSWRGNDDDVLFFFFLA